MSKPKMDTSREIQGGLMALEYIEGVIRFLASSKCQKVRNQMEAGEYRDREKGEFSQRPLECSLWCLRVPK